MSYCLVDLNQVLIANMMQNIKLFSDNRFDESLMRHMALNTIRANTKQFKSKYPNVVLCCDNKRFWRKEVFPFYKAHRKADRANSGLDWSAIFETLNKLRSEFKEYLPYKIIDVDGAEADDVIAVLTALLSANDSVLILSSDKDFAQLQKYPNVTQYSPIMKRFIKIDDPHRFVREHILRGDRGDGIPNFLSSDNCFVVGERQKPISSKKLNEWVTQDTSQFCTTDDMQRNFLRNQTLVDFDYIPENLRASIVSTFNDIKPAPKAKLLEYFIDNNLKAMIESISDF